MSAFRRINENKINEYVILSCIVRSAPHAAVCHNMTAQHIAFGQTFVRDEFGWWLLISIYRKTEMANGCMSRKSKLFLHSFSIAHTKINRGIPWAHLFLCLRISFLLPATSSGSEKINRFIANDGPWGLRYDVWAVRYERCGVSRETKIYAKKFHMNLLDFCSGQMNLLGVTEQCLGNLHTRTEQNIWQTNMFEGCNLRWRISTWVL